MKLNLSILLILLVGCVSIETPDNLVSDTYKVSKDIYYSITGTKGASKDLVGDFSYEYLIPKEEQFTQSNEKCLLLAVQKAKEETNQYRINIKKTQTLVSEVKGKPALICSVSIH